MKAPTETIPKPGSSSPSSSSERGAARAPGFALCGPWSACWRWAKPTPEAAVRERIAMTAKVAPNTVMPQVERDARRRGSASSASPTTPPSPVGRGQLPGAGSSEASAAAQAMPTT